LKIAKKYKGLAEVSSDALLTSGPRGNYTKAYGRAIEVTR
jgi:hypothetical protein